MIDILFDYLPAIVVALAIVAGVNLGAAWARARYAFRAPRRPRTRRRQPRAVLTWRRRPEPVAPFTHISKVLKNR